MASGASSLDSNESNDTIPHNFVPTSDCGRTINNASLPIPIEYDVLNQGSCYDKQANFSVIKQHGYEGISSVYDSMNQPQYEALSKQNQNEGFKQHSDKTMQELNTLRRQHSETSRRCDHAMKELEYFRSQHRAAMNQLEVSAQETNNLRGKYGDLLNDNQRLEREVQRLQECQSGNGGASDNDSALIHTLQKYKTVKEEYECLHKRYDEVLSNHAATAEELQVCQEENSRLKGQCHDLTQERNVSIRERAALKQQCAAAVAQWEAALRERAELRAALARKQTSSSHPPTAGGVPGVGGTVGSSGSAADIKRLTDERNAAMHEYTLIMSERDTVHKEMEKLSDDLQAALKRVSVLESALQSARDERRALALQAETLRREIASALHDRDRALKECSDLKAPQNISSGQGKLRTDNSSYHLHGHLSGGSGKDGSGNGVHNADTSIDKLQGLVGMVLNPRNKERMDNLEQANQELERLRKSLDKLQGELTEAHQEAEVSKRRRDWAFSERDKIVLERESIRTLCDRLRKERDRAVSDLAEALRDSDDIKKQRNEASKELKELKEKLESELEKESGSCRSHHSSMSHNPSRDSAIDSDLQEWDSELLEIDLTGIPNDGDFGFELAGGRDDPYYPKDYSIYVASVQKGSFADGKLRPLDRVVAAGGAVGGALATLGGRGVANALRLLPRLTVRRRRALSNSAHITARLRPNHRDTGLHLHQGIYITKVASGSVAAKDGTLSAGDRIISINNRSMDSLKGAMEAMMLLNDRNFETVTITVIKHLPNATLLDSEFSNRFCPIKEIKSPYQVAHTNRRVNSCSQTEEPWYQYQYSSGAVERKSPAPYSFENSVSDFDRRYVYRVTSGSQGKAHQEKGTWDMIMGKIEAVTGRNKSKDKQHRQSAVPECDAIAELDSVIDSYHGKSSKESSSTSGVLKRSKRRNKDSQSTSESMKNNGGTWPKARSNVIFQQNPTGTIVHPRSKKERLPLSILLSPPTKLQSNEQSWTVNRNSNPIPLGHLPLTQSVTPVRHSVYKSIESAPNSSSAHFPKSAPLSIHNPFATPNTINFDKLRLEMEHDGAPNRMSVNLNPSDDSLDYQPVTGDNKSPHSLDFISVSSSNKGPNSLEFVQPLSIGKSPNRVDFNLKSHGKDVSDYYRAKKSSPKTVSKYPSDSESLGPESLNGLNSHSRIQSQPYRGAVGSPFPARPQNSAPIKYQHPASPTIAGTQCQSGESLGANCDYIQATFGSHSHNVGSHSHNVSDLQPSSRVTYGHRGYEGGTFPRKNDNQRFRIPSNPSVASKNSAGKVSSGSIERSSERGSPMPTFHVEVLSPGRGAKQIPHSNPRNSMPEYCGLGWHKPLPGELRRVHIDKSQQPLGIQISCPPESGGVFVSTVNERSLASQVGLQVGDQLLEVCGINMRSATYKLAANVLRQCGNSITMLVQYSPDKYDEAEGSGGSSGGGSGAEASGSPTPRNSPGPQRSRPEAAAPAGGAEPRFLLVEMRQRSDLGVSLVGGNAVGVFVHGVRRASPACEAGLRTGDRLLQCNGADLRRATAEQAALELAKPADKVSVLAQYDLQQYHNIKDKPGDAFYVRAGFERGAELASSGVDSLDPYSLWFRRDEVLFVDNTLFNGAPGLWRAWQLDHKGNKQQWGTIPSKFKVEELLRRSVGSLEGEGTGRRGSTSARRSFFRRKKHRHSKELASFNSLGWWSDSGTLTDLPLLSYQRVDKLHYPSHRPVVVLGPLWECVVDKVVNDFPALFGRIAPEPVQLTGSSLDRALSQGKYLEPRKRGHYLECLNLQTIKDVCEKGMHCILDISVTSIEKLHKHQIYPIVLLIKFKSTKQIKEVKDTRYSMEKVSAKAAKEMYEHALKLEMEYRNCLSAVIPAGINIAYMCTQLKAAVEEEQGKTLWVPSVQA